MTQEEAGVATRVERRGAPRVSTNRAALCWGLGVSEGLLAALTLLVPTLIYHLAFAHVSMANMSFALYGAYAGLIGLAYGAFSAAAAAKFLDESHYRPASLADSSLDWTAAFAVALLAAFLAGLAGDLSRVSLTSAYLIGIPVLLAGRSMSRAWIARRVTAGRLQYRRAGIIGNHSDVVRYLFNATLWRSGYQLTGTLYLDEIEGDDSNTRQQSVVEFARRCVANGAGYIVVVGNPGEVDQLELFADMLKRFAINVACVPATENKSFKFIDVVPMGANNALRFLRMPLGESSLLMKRMLDLCGAGFGLVLLSPLFAFLALAIKLDSAGAVFYRQERRGFNGKTFFIWKFRSMHVTESGSKMTQVRVGDSRITKVGRFIRAHSLDELPQLINVLRGEMSLVGPRPHALVHDDELGDRIASYAHRQRLKPGITGWAQINGYRGETTTMEQIEGRTLHDLYYIDNWSLGLDCWIILLTVFSRKAHLNAV